MGEDVLDLRPVIRGRGRHDLAADDPVLPVDADVGLVAADRNGDVNRLPRPSGLAFAFLCLTVQRVFASETVSCGLRPQK